MSKYPGMSTNEILRMIPQKYPFRYVDEIIEVDENHIMGSYTFKNDEFFYQGHFPNKPVTPGVILLECMGQVGVVAMGIYLMSLEYPKEEMEKWTTMFCDSNVEFLKPVYPGDKVIIRGAKQFWRRKKIRANIELSAPDGTLIAQTNVSGIGVRNE